MMRLLKVFMVMVVLMGISAYGQDPGQHGIQTADLDRNADPCTDFFEFANGTWRTQHPIPPSMSRWSRRWEAGELSKNQLKDILDDVSRRHDWPSGSVEQIIGDYYGSCMAEDRINKLGVSPIQPLLTGIEHMKNADDLQRMIRRFHELLIFVPFGLTSTSDNHNPGQVIADVFASGLGLPDRDYYLKPEQRFQEAREKYHLYIVNLFKLSGASESESKTAADKVLAMEKKLAEATLDNVSLRDPQATDHKTTFESLRKLAPSVDWNGYFQDANLSRADLNVDQPKFLQEVDRQFREIPLADWKIYLKWHLLNSSSRSLSAPFVQENFNFQERYLNGATEMKPRWKRCVESEDSLLGEALGKKYVEKYFPPEAKARAQEMVKNVLAAMHDTIEGLQWMGPETRKKALEKLSTFNPKIGYPEKWLDYHSVKIRPETFWANVMAGRKFNSDDDRVRIGKPVDRGRWGMTPPTSNAYYNPLLNEIVFPAGILQPPAFSMDAVDAVNYGSIGVVIGHEISHGFDDQGAKYDALGALNNWWTADDFKNFEARTSCVAHQFDDYYIEPGIHHNGKLVLGESIGDVAGAKIAYLAFKKSQQGKPPAPTIAGFTPDQQFFIAWGQWRGDAIRPETQRKMVQGDEHPIAKYRVIGPLSNLPAFAEAFGCKKDSAMVRAPAERCEVW